MPVFGYGMGWNGVAFRDPLDQFGPGRTDDFVGNNDVPDILAVAECFGPL